MFERIINALNYWSPASIFVLALLITAVLAALDYLAGPDLSLSVFYLIPVALAAWCGGRQVGAATALLTTVAWAGENLAQSVVFSHSAIFFWEAFSRLLFFILTAEMLFKIRSLLDREYRLARRDMLTGAFNSRAFKEELDRTLALARRQRQSIAVAYLDLDNFKAINDTYGHTTGDRLLITVVSAIQHCVRGYDVVARLGGDEFAILLPATDYNNAQMACNKIKSHVLEEMAKANWPVTMSMGVVIFDKPPAGIDEVLNLADRFMYSVKKNGKNDIRYCYVEGDVVNAGAN